MFCNKCGKELRDGAQFCSGCGAQLKVVPVYKPEEAEASTDNVTPQADGAMSGPPPVALQDTSRKKKRGLWLLLTLILVAGVGCAVYFLFLREKPSKENPSDASSSQAISGPDTLNPGPQDMRPKIWARTEDAEIAQLIDRYFQAKAEANAAEMERIMIPGATVDSVLLSKEAQVYEWYRDIRVYSYPGMASMETGLFVTYYSKFKNIDTPLPTIAWFYAKPDKENNLKLMPLTDDASSEYKYIYSTYAGSLVEKLAGEVSAANKKAIENDPNLKQYLAQLATKNYEPFVPETTTALSTTAPSSTAAPSSATAQTAPQPTTAAPTTRATEAPTTEAPTTEEAVKTPALVNLRYEELERGMIVTFGEYEQDNNSANGSEEIEWILYYVGEKNYYLISCYILDAVPFSSSSSSTGFEGSDLDQWLEGTTSSFENTAFSSDEKKVLELQELEPCENVRYPSAPQTGLIYRRAANFSLNELLDYLPSTFYQAVGTPYALARGLKDEKGYSPWWTRTMGRSGKYAGYVTSKGKLNYDGLPVDSYDVGVRPVIAVSKSLFSGQTNTEPASQPSSVVSLESYETYINSHLHELDMSRHFTYEGCKDYPNIAFIDLTGDGIPEMLTVSYDESDSNQILNLRAYTAEAGGSREILKPNGTHLMDLFWDCTSPHFQANTVLFGIGNDIYFYREQSAYERMYFKEEYEIGQLRYQAENGTLIWDIMLEYSASSEQAESWLYYGESISSERYETIRNSLFGSADRYIFYGLDTGFNKQVYRWVHEETGDYTGLSWMEALGHIRQEK